MKTKPLLTFLLMGLLALGLSIRQFFYAPLASKSPAQEQVFEVRRGMTLGYIADSLQLCGLLSNPTRLKVVARVTGLDQGIQLGSFQFSSEMSPVDFLQTLQHYQVPEWEVCLNEGLRFEQSISLICQSTGLDSLRFMQLASDSAFLASLQLPFPTLQGCLFPETYRFSSLEDEEGILRALAGAFMQVWQDALASAQEQRGRVGSKVDEGISSRLTELELLTLASIVQGEVVLALEADTVASVYRNRLDIGMKLQADPTVQFLLKDGPRRLLYSDLRIESPYNTYWTTGLPPGPINSPGRVAMKAAMEPAKTDYLYFVARGDGGHFFSRSYEEHLRLRKPLDAARKRMGR
jgi:UPF0755 protein